MKNLLLVILVLPLISAGEAGQKDQEDVWGPLRYFVGKWEGIGGGKFGPSTLEREYTFILQDKFLHVKNRSVSPPTEKLPKGEVHEDWGFYSYDGGRKRFVLRQVHVEGFVNQFIAEPAPEPNKPPVFTTESIENLPPGWRARETYNIINKNEFEEIFELAKPGEDFQACVQNRMKRKR